MEWWGWVGVEIMLWFMTALWPEVYDVYEFSARLFVVHLFALAVWFIITAVAS